MDKQTLIYAAVGIGLILLSVMLFVSLVMTAVRENKLKRRRLSAGQGYKALKKMGPAFKDVSPETVVFYFKTSGHIQELAEAILNDGSSRDVFKIILLAKLLSDEGIFIMKDEWLSDPRVAGRPVLVNNLSYMLGKCSPELLRRYETVKGIKKDFVEIITKYISRALEEEKKKRKFKKENEEMEFSWREKKVRADRGELSPAEKKGLKSEVKETIKIIKKDSKSDKEEQEKQAGPSEEEPKTAEGETVVTLEAIREMETAEERVEPEKPLQPAPAAVEISAAAMSEIKKENASSFETETKPPSGADKSALRKKKTSAAVSPVKPKTGTVRPAVLKKSGIPAGSSPALPEPRAVPSPAQEAEATAVQGQTEEGREKAEECFRYWEENKLWTSVDDEQLAVLKDYPDIYDRARARISSAFDSFIRSSAGQENKFERRMEQNPFEAVSAVSQDNTFIPPVKAGAETGVCPAGAPPSAEVPAERTVSETAPLRPEQAEAKAEQEPPAAEGEMIAGIYQVSSLLSSVGGGIKFYRAKDAITGKDFIIKEISKRLFPDESYKTYFFDKVRVAMSFDHPNLSKIYDITEDGKAVYAVLEYAPGKSLREALSANKGPVSTEEARPVAGALAAAVNFLGENKIMHGLISPSSVVLSEDGQLKISNFGVGVLKEEGTDSPYFAPELQIAPGDHTADVYSFGAVLYEMFTASAPFSGKDIYGAQMDMRFRRPCEVNPALDKETSDMITLCLSGDKSRRPFPL